MTVRDSKQKNFAKLWLESERKSILYLCPRFGKIRTTIHILNQSDYKNILILYPNDSIKKSWLNDFEELKFDYSNVKFSTFKSLHKCYDQNIDLLIIDEIHELSENNITQLYEIINKTHSDILGLTGTLANDTKMRLYNSLKLRVLATYSIEEAIKDNVITDYSITVIKVPLDNKITFLYKKEYLTEKKQYNKLSKTINYFETINSNPYLVKSMKLQRLKMLQNSLSKVKYTKFLLEKFKDERILVFCGSVETTKELEIPTNNSKNKNEEGFLKFANGEGNHFSVIKIGNSGITYKPLNKVIILNIDRDSENLTQKINRCMAIEYNNPDKKSNIYIIISDENVELNWVNKALSFFDNSKINFVDSVNFSKLLNN